MIHSAFDLLLLTKRKMAFLLLNPFKIIRFVKAANNFE